MLEQGDEERKQHKEGRPLESYGRVVAVLGLLCLALMGCNRGPLADTMAPSPLPAANSQPRDTAGAPPSTATLTRAIPHDTPTVGRATARTATAISTASIARPSESPTTAPTAQPSDTPSRGSSPTPTVTATATRVPISVRWGELTISTYAYEQALYTDPQKAGHPYALLDRSKVGPPRARTYKVLIVRNEYLELTFMPEMGGRLYQCRFLPTGQELFYNNSVIKPTHWGPPDQGWWLAIGGMEWCLPVDEHGYLTAEPWIPEVIRQPDGSVIVVMSAQERSRSIEVRVALSLHPGESGFTVRSTLYNPEATPKRVQYWLNAMLAPGAHSVQPSLRFFYPASEVIVHSRGDKSLPDAQARMSWPLFDGRDLSQYATWKNWLGFFAPTLRSPFTAVYDEAAQLGIVRIFPPESARGVKLFAFGPDFGDVGAYTDDGSEYVEMWGGLTPTFWDYAVLEPQGRASWEESWYVLSRSGGPDLATAQASVHVSREANMLGITVAAPREAHWVLHVYRGDREVAQQRLDIRPEAPFQGQVALEAGSSDEDVSIKILDLRGAEVMVYSP